MATCKDCLHYDVCAIVRKNGDDRILENSPCKHFLSLSFDPNDVSKMFMNCERLERIPERDMLIDTLNGILKEHFDFVPIDKSVKIADALLSYGLTFGEEVVKE